MGQSEQKKVWILSSGSYSDYSVLGVFDDDHKEVAEEIAASITEGDCEESFILNHFDCEEVPQGKRFYRLTMYRDGSSDFEVDDETEFEQLDCLGERHREFWSLETKERYSWVRKSHWRLDLDLYAESKKHAVKRANEMRIQLLASQMPLEKWYGDL